MTIQQARNWVQQSQALVITAGAGMGVDAGLPDFRGSAGLWRAFPALRERGMALEDIATPHWFDEDPALAWGFYGHRLLSYRAARPHAGHQVLRRWCAARPHHIITSNVDGLFQQAEWEDRAIWEMHGTIQRWQCSTPCSDQRWPARLEELSLDPHSGLAKHWPLCPHCGAVARPNLMMFGDAFWISDDMAAAEQAFRAFIDQHRGPGLLVIEVGAGTTIPTMRNMGEWLMLEYEARLLRINPADDADQGDWHPRLCTIRQGAATALPALAADGHIASVPESSF
ncbi:MAG: NAD-dependent deacetylase [Planctomycetota bacterium]|nr:MAG: NAD-dependent deacetylase [Planctomycetota bacterium]